MEVFNKIEDLKNWLNRSKEIKSSVGTQAKIGFVPTLGYLHEGHVSLINTSTSENELTVLSIFVNPLQFGEGEDFETYPRDRERDLDIAVKNGVNAVFIPDLQEMYPQPMKMKIAVSGKLTDQLCGASRPGHFDGVATVVMKLIHIVQPDQVYFGLKDAQQVAIIKQMAEDFHLPVQIVACPTVREEDGLAKSSRNVYLSNAERQQAVVLPQALDLGERWIKEGERTKQEIVQAVKARIEASSLAAIDYVEMVEYPSLNHIDDTYRPNNESSVLLAAAVRFGRTRLIDNRLFDKTTKSGGA